VRAIEIDGTPADVAALGEHIGATVTAVATFPVRNQQVRGLDHHLDRLVGYSRDSRDRQEQRESVEQVVSAFIRSHDGLERVRVERFRPADGGQERTLIMRCDPRPALASEIEFCTALRERRAAIDEPGGPAALQLDDGAIHGATVGAIGFVSRGRVIWPDSAAAPTVERLLTHKQLRASDVVCAVVPVRLDDVGLFEASFIIDDHGVSIVTAINDVAFVRDDQVADVRQAFDRIPWWPV
jgi:hypothetical protein